MEVKLSVLEKVAALLTDRGIKWAVGASAMLYLRGLVTHFDDLDIVVSEKDALHAKQCLSSLGTLLPEVPGNQCKSKVFLQYVVDGVALDVMAGLTFFAEGQERYFPFEQEDVTHVLKRNGVAIPLHSLEAWHTYYALMGRAEKAALLAQALGRPPVM